MARGLSQEVATVLQTLNSNVPALGTEVTDPAEARRRFADLRPVTSVKTQIESVHDEVFRHPDGHALTLRWYTPLQQRAPESAVVLYLHGGGWVLGSLDSHDELVRRMAAGTRLRFVSVDYRLAPEHPFPAALSDAVSALVHVRARLANDTRVLVAGDSAGANLAAALCMVMRDSGGPALAGQILLYPILDRRRASQSYRDNASGFYISARHLEWFWEQYLGVDRGVVSPYAAPAEAEDLTHLPSAHIVTAEFDPLRDEGGAYGSRLADAGVECSVRRYPGAFHGFLAYGEHLEMARQAQREIYEAILRLAGVSP